MLVVEWGEFCISLLLCFLLTGSKPKRSHTLKLSAALPTIIIIILQPLESLQTHIHTRELGRRRLVQGAAGFQNQKKAGSARLAPSREMIQQG